MLLDFTGKEIQSVFKGEQNLGEQKFSLFFDDCFFSSGIYFVKIS